MKKAVWRVLSIVALLGMMTLGGGAAQTTRYRVGATCNDGTTSTATGRGACSHHGGVRCWLYNDGTCTKP